MIKYSRTADVKQPLRSTGGSAGIDFFIPNTMKPTVVQPQQAVKFSLGVRVALEPGTCMLFVNKSGICMRHQLVVGACLIDSDYQGEVNCHVINTGTEPVWLEPGTKIVQGIVLQADHELPVELPDDALFDTVTARGDGGFGSTGVK